MNIQFKYIQVYLAAFTLTCIKDNLREERIAQIRQRRKKREYPGNDKLEIWSTSSTIKSQNSEGKLNVSITNELYSNLPPLTDIKWGPRPGYEYFNGGSSEIQKDFLAPDFSLIFFLCFFLLFNKIILLFILLTQIRKFRVLFVLRNHCISRRCVDF